MPVRPGSPLDRIHRGIFCGPTGTATFGYFCFVDDIVDQIVSGGTNRGSTKSLPYSGDEIWKRYEDRKKEIEEREDILEDEKRLLREDEEIILIFKMFLRCQ